MDRPPADPVKLLSAWEEWETGETPPGRVISNLKTGGLPDVMAHLATDAAAPVDGVDLAALLETWGEWEAGTSTPPAVAVALQAGGLRPLLEGLAGQGSTGGDSG